MLISTKTYSPDSGSDSWSQACAPSLVSQCRSLGGRKEEDMTWISTLLVGSCEKPKLHRKVSTLFSRRADQPNRSDKITFSEKGGAAVSLNTQCCFKKKKKERRKANTRRPAEKQMDVPDDKGQWQASRLRHAQLHGCDPSQALWNSWYRPQSTRCRGEAQHDDN